MKAKTAREVCRDFSREELLDTIDDLAAERDDFSAEMVAGDKKIAALESENARLREIISDRDKRDAGFLRCESCGDWFSELSRGHDCDLCDKCADELLDDARKE